MRLTILNTFLVVAFSAMLLTGCRSAGESTGAKPVKSVTKGGPVFNSEADKMHFDNLFFDATKARLLGKYEEAADKYEQCLKITTGVADVYYQLSVCYNKLGRPGSGEMLDKAIDLAPKNTWYLEEKALSLKVQRKHAEAAGIYEKLVELAPDNLAYYEEAVNLLIQSGKHDDAIDMLDKMEGRFGVSEEVIRKKEDLYLYQGKYDKAIAEVQKLLSSAPNHVPYLGLMAEVYSLAGKHQKAKEYYQKILSIEPKNGLAHFGLANIYRLEGDSANTIKEMLLAFDDPEVPVGEKVNVIMSMAPLGDNDPEYRRQVFSLAEILVNTHPDEPQAHALYGDLLFGDGQLAKAAAQYQRTLELNDNNYKVWQQLLACYEQLGDFDKLAVESDKALELFPNRLLFYYFNATAAYQQSNYKKAAATAQAGIDLGVKDKQVNVSLYNIVGSSYYKLTRYNESYAAFEEALTLDPENVLVLNNYAYYLSVQGDHLEKALAMSKKTIEISPNNPAYLDTYGWILYKSERYSDALEYIAKALELSPRDGEIMEHLGDVHYRLGNKEEAAKYWQKSKDNGNDSVQLDRKINEGKLSD